VAIYKFILDVDEADPSYNILLLVTKWWSPF